MSNKQEPVSRTLAGWSSRLGYDDIPPEVASLAKLRFLDALGVKLAAECSDVGRAVARIVEKQVGGLATPGSGQGAQYPLDAFFDGTMTACLDFDDTHDETLIHPSSAVCPALMSTIKRVGTSGFGFVTALVAGYEVCCRIGMAAPGQFHKKGFHPTGVIGAVGAAATVAKVLGYDASVTEHALGIAASISGGLLQAMIDGTDSRYVNAGSAALNGVLAGMLAGEGVSGAGAPIDGQFGLLRAHTDNDAKLCPTRITDDLGSRWETCGIVPKPYPTGYVTHEFIDAILALTEEYDLCPEDVDEIECTVEEKAARLVLMPADQKVAPQRASAARVALPHILAEAVVFRDIGAASFSGQRMHDARVRALAMRVRHRVGKGAEDNQLVVSIRSRGKLVSKTSKRIMTADNIVEKFVANTESIFGKQGARDTVDMILGAERENDFGSILMRLEESRRRTLT